jgi:hypothetical protein
MAQATVQNGNGSSVVVKAGNALTTNKLPKETLFHGISVINLDFFSCVKFLF